MTAFVEGSLTDTIADFGSLVVTLAAVAGIVWGVVSRATRPIRDQLDAIKSLTESLRQERERVDDMSDRLDGLERRVGAVERRVEDVYRLLVQFLTPVRGGRRAIDPEPDDDT